MSLMIPSFLGVAPDKLDFYRSLGGAFTSPNLVQDRVKVGRYTIVSLHHSVRRKAVCAHLIVVVRVSVCNHSVCFANGNQLGHGTCLSSTCPGHIVFASLSKVHPVPAEVSAVTPGRGSVTKDFEELPWCRHRFMFNVVRGEVVAAVGESISR